MTPSCAEHRQGGPVGSSPAVAVPPPGWVTVLPYLPAVVVLLMFRSVLPVTLCDDAYISFRVADNLAHGNGWSFNPGEQLYVATNPLWVALLALLHAAGAEILSAARFLGTLFEILLLLTLVHWGGRLREGSWAGMLAAVLLVANPVFLLTSFSGMELPMYLFIFVLAAYLMSQRRAGAAAAVAATAVWVRFDGLIVYGVALAWIVVTHRNEIRNRFTPFALKMLPSWVMVGAYFAFGIVVFGTAVPVSVQRKAAFAPIPFSAEWMNGVGALAGEFFKAGLGRSAYWYVSATPYWLFGITAIIGIVLHLLRRDRTLLPLLAMTAACVGAFVGSGTVYATNFPWVLCADPARMVSPGCVRLPGSIGKCTYGVALRQEGG